MKILITAATSATAHQLKNKLHIADVILGDYTDLPAFMRKSIIRLPNPAANTYAHEMLTLCLDNGIDTIYLLNTVEFEALAGSGQLFKEYNIEIINGSDNL